MAVTERVANKLRWSSTFEQRARGELDTGKHRYDPRKDCLVDFDCVAQRNKQIEHRSGCSLWNDDFSRGDTADNHIFRVAETLEHCCVARNCRSGRRRFPCSLPFQKIEGALEDNSA